MDRTTDELQNVALKKDESGLTQLNHSIGFQSLLDWAQVLLGQNVIVVQPKRSVKRDTNDMNSSITTHCTGSTVFKDDQVTYKTGRTEKITRHKLFRKILWIA